MIDAQGLKDDGCDLENMVCVIEKCLWALKDSKSREGRVMQNILEGFRDDCEALEEIEDK